MKKIVVGFSKSSKKFPIVSWVIRMYQCSNFSHTYLKLFMSSLPSNKILHASEGLVQNMSETQFNKKHIVVEEYEIEIPDVFVLDGLTNTRKTLYRSLVGLMHETAGDNYSIMQNVGITYVDFMRWAFKKRVKNPWAKGWNCSEFVLSILILLYPEEFKGIDPNTVTPKEIQTILKVMDASDQYSIKRV